MVIGPLEKIKEEGDRSVGMGRWDWNFKEGTQEMPHR